MPRFATLNIGFGASFLGQSLVETAPVLTPSGTHRELMKWQLSRSFLPLGTMGFCR
jgi:hypothetical protein